MKIINKIKELNKEEEKVDIKTTIYIYILIFFIGSLIGWIYEEIFYKVTENILENRGFLYGPYVPVYGTGAVLIIAMLKRFKKNPAIFFIASMIVTGILEYLVGDLMWRIWQRRWWDYTGLFMNVNGYICLRSLISFAIGAIPLVYILEPIIRKKTINTSVKTRNIVSITLISIMVIDLIITLTIRHPIV